MPRSVLRTARQQAEFRACRFAIFQGVAYVGRKNDGVGAPPSLYQSPRKFEEIAIQKDAKIDNFLFLGVGTCRGTTIPPDSSSDLPIVSFGNLLTL